MEYYRITQRKNLPNCIRPPYLSLTDIWSETAPVFVPGIADRPKEEITFLPFYETNVFFLSGPLRAIWERSQVGGRYRQCAFGSVEQRKVQPYCFMMPRILSAVHPDTRYRRNGEIEELCLDREIVGAHKVFGVKDQRKIFLIVSADVLEEMMRSGVTVLHWEEVLAR